jgi:membrane-associated protease RseP (regulator of RpoE activity)
MILTFLVSLYICIIFHELGHLFAAKIVKCKVEVFSIGFGKELFSFNYKGTKYRIALLPLGGYNKLKDELTCSRSKYAFTNLKYRDKLFIVCSGCVINIFMGLVAFNLGTHFLNYNLYYFGWLSLALGISNLLPIPALDGSYPILVWLEKIYGKKRGYEKMNKVCKVGFIILTILNIACIPLLIKLIIQGAL